MKPHECPTQLKEALIKSRRVASFEFSPAFQRRDHSGPFTLRRVATTESLRFQASCDENPSLPSFPALKGRAKIISTLCVEGT